MKPAQPPHTEPDWPALLHAKGLRVTQATLLVLELMQQAHSALSHEELEQLVIALDASNKPDRVTLYRILERLCQAGLLRKVRHSDRSWRFALAQEQETGNFECTECHELTPLEADEKLSEAMALIGTYLKTKGQQAVPSFLNAQGVCAKCVN
ncbi:MAG: hypothetical protein HC858_12945 [Brachymonas sp.]|nr:hypothetical protein [Brachymonas sp.]